MATVHTTGRIVQHLVKQAWDWGLAEPAQSSPQHTPELHLWWLPPALMHARRLCLDDVRLCVLLLLRTGLNSG